MWHKPCRTFHPWCPCIKTRCLSFYLSFDTKMLMIWRVLTVLFWLHYNVIKWKHFPRYWPFVRGIHRSPVNSPHKCQWRGALKFSLICVWINDWGNNREVDDLRRGHYDVIVMHKHVVIKWAKLTTKRLIVHYSDVKWAPRHFKSTAFRLFVH